MAENESNQVEVESGLSEKSRAELVSIASKKGVPDASKMKKDELLEALAPVEAQVVAEGQEQPAQVFTPEDEVEEEAAPDFYPSPYGRRVAQKAVLYTDGISGVADLNHERAYEYNERFQSSDANERTTGDVSLSEAAKAQKSEEEKRRAARVKSGDSM